MIAGSPEPYSSKNRRTPSRSTNPVLSGYLARDCSATREGRTPASTVIDGSHHHPTIDPPRPSRLRGHPWDPVRVTWPASARLVIGRPTPGAEKREPGQFRGGRPFLPTGELASIG